MRIVAFSLPGVSFGTEFLVLVGAVLVFFLLGGLVGLWIIFGRGPRRNRLYNRARNLLHLGNWQAALNAVEQLESAGALSAQWQGRAQNLKGECYRAAGDQALKEQRYEESREHYVTAARLLHLSETEACNRLVEAMLADLRRLFGTGVSKDTDNIHLLVLRITQVDVGCSEAYFWQGLAYTRDGKTDLAVASLQTAREGAANRALDPSLYLGALLVREGRAAEALRYLAETNRQEPNCPFVSWQLGSAIVAAGGDCSLAIHALQRALGSRGLPLWIKTPHRAWLEGLPEGRSYVRKLALQNNYTCPLMGGDVATMVRRAQLALAQAYYRQGNFKEAGEQYNLLLQEAAPSIPVLQGLGLSLAQQGRYDEAFKHLRAAHELEEFKSPITAAYLALCGARGKPSRPEDRPNNVQWAVQLLRRFDIRGDRDWASINSAIFAEARALNLPLAREDQERLCEVLASVEACDAAAAAAYGQLAGSFPDAIKPEYAWLYCRAAQLHGVRMDHDVDLFNRTFSDTAAARAYFTARSWDFDTVEHIYLERWAEQQPGRFPELLGPDYPALGERLLLARSEQQERAGQLDAAQATAATRLRLAPRSGAAHDRLACLFYRRGNLDEAVKLLADWQTIDPQDARPLLRRAVIEQQRGNSQGRTEAIQRGLDLTRGRARAQFAFLGGMLAIREAVHVWKQQVAASQNQGDGSPPPPAFSADGNSALRQGLDYFQECLKDDAGHPEALTYLAALRFVSGDRDGLAAQAASMNQPELKNPRFQYLASVCQLACQDYANAQIAAQQAMADPALAVEASYLKGLALMRLDDSSGAAAALQQVADSPGAASSSHARALLGWMAIRQGAYEEATKWWNGLDADRRAAWGIDAALHGTVLLGGLIDLKGERFEMAAEKFREAARLGARDARLPRLQTLALVRAGERLLTEEKNGLGESQDTNKNPSPGSNQHPAATAAPQLTDADRAAQLLEQAMQVGGRDAYVAYLLAVAYRHKGKPRDARNALRQIPRPDANVFLQMGLLSLQEKLLGQAEQEFVQAWKLSRQSGNGATNMTLGGSDGPGATMIADQSPASIAGTEVSQSLPTESEQRPPTAYPACANLLLTRLSLGQLEAGAALLPEVMELTEDPAERQVWSWLQILLRSWLPPNADGRPDPALSQINAQDEQQLLALVCSLGRLETITPLLKTMVSARPGIGPIRQAYFEALIVQGKQLLDRCDWATAEKLLTPMVREKSMERPIQLAFLNLVGCSACLTHNFQGGIRHFSAAHRMANNDPRLHQNLALAYDLNGDLPNAEAHWNRYFDLLHQGVPRPPDSADYLHRLNFEGLIRLATRYTEKEKWSHALTYVERAYRLRPDHPETLDRLFHLYNQNKRPDDARRILAQLRKLRPDDPQFDLFELELVEVRDVDDLDRLVPGVIRVLERYPGDSRVEDRATGKLLPAMQQLYRQLTDQMNKVRDQVRELPNYQINWRTVHEVMHDLKLDYQKLRRMIGKCLQLIKREDHRRTLRDLDDQIGRKIEVCRRWED